MPDADEVRMREDARRQRLEILDALVLAIDRRAEVFDLIAGSESADAARMRVGSLLGISEIAATAVLDVQARRFARLEADRIRQERDDMREGR